MIIVSQVRVEVLGVLDRSSGRLRLRATEPCPGMSPAERSAIIFKVLPQWVSKTSRLAVDNSIDKERLK